MTSSIVVEQWIDAPPAKVYRHLTTSGEWARWQGIAAHLDARAGGVFSMRMANGMLARGQFQRLVENESVVFTWGWVDQPGIPPGSTSVEITLTAQDGGTLVRLTHSNLPEGEAELHTFGWKHHLPRLAVVAEGGDPGPDLGPGGASLGE